jgi:hypothetical protein
LYFGIDGHLGERDARFALFGEIDLLGLEEFQEFRKYGLGLAPTLGRGFAPWAGVFTRPFVATNFFAPRTVFRASFRGLVMAGARRGMPFDRNRGVFAPVEARHHLGFERQDGGLPFKFCATLFGAVPEKTVEETTNG